MTPHERARLCCDYINDLHEHNHTNLLERQLCINFLKGEFTRAIQEEREACAAVCDLFATSRSAEGNHQGVEAATTLAKFIRRGVIVHQEIP